MKCDIPRCETTLVDASFLRSLHDEPNYRENPKVQDHKQQGRIEAEIHKRPRRLGIEVHNHINQENAISNIKK